VRIPISISSDRQIVVVRALAHYRDEGIVVGGDVRRVDSGSFAVAGHLHVTGRNAAGLIIASTDAPWGEFKNRRFRLAYFEALLKPQKPGDIMAISIDPVTTPDE
jgi:hypothetical protein